MDQMRNMLISIGQQKQVRWNTNGDHEEDGSQRDAAGKELSQAAHRPAALRAPAAATTEERK